MKHLPPLNYIRSFESAARHLSFTRAADELGMTQSAVSGHVRALEQFIGRPLFYRSPRSLSLTEVAEAYLPALRRALGQIDTATGQIHTARRRQEVLLACPASLATNWLPPRLLSFRRKHPEIAVTVHATIWAEAADQIVDLRISPRHVGQPLLGKSLGRERLAVVCAPSLVQGPGAVGTPAQLVQRGLIHVLGRQDLWEDFARHHGLGPLPLVEGLKTDSSNVALELAAAGMGAAATLASLAEVHLRRGVLVEPFPAEIPSSWGYDLHPGEIGLSKPSELLMAHLLAPQAA